MCGKNKKIISAGGISVAMGDYFGKLISEGGAIA